MTRDETVALFLQGREAWNAWAERTFAERKELEAAGRWSTEKQPKGDLEPRNEETRAWMEAATADFSQCLFLIAGATVEVDEEELTFQAKTKSIQLDTISVDLNGFIFPGDAWFERATFTGTTGFERTTFAGRAWFDSAAFSGRITFDSAAFTGPARFERAAFEGETRFRGATFADNAWFDSAIFSAGARFEGCRFLGKASFDQANLAGDGKFENIIFLGEAVFDSATFSGNASFIGANFKGDTRFDFATFSKPAWFDRATFFGVTRFDGTNFSDIVVFGGTIFWGNARFGGDSFSSRYAWFENVTFSSEAGFQGAVFSGDAWFAKATFACAAEFKAASFAKFTTFGEAQFQREAGFMGVKAERAFDLTGTMFAQVPTFNQADFKQAPDLDDVRFPLPGFWRGGNAKLVAQYRALRRMAIQGADYEREQMAYKGELRSRRWTVDKWWSIGTWIGLFYDAFADCGRSIVRPANAWCASILLFAAFYWQRAAADAPARCEEAGGAAVQALFLSVKNALVIFGGTRDARVNQAYLCLYNGSAEQPRIPPTVTFVETLAQIPVSATLIFLFLLAVKNRFKIK